MNEDTYLAGGEGAEDGGHRRAFEWLVILVLILVLLIGVERGEALVGELDRRPGRVVLQLVGESRVFNLEVTLRDDDLCFSWGQDDTPARVVSAAHGRVLYDAYQGAIATTMTNSLF